MPKPNPTEFGRSSELSNVSALDASQLHRHANLQRLFVVTMGCLWVLAFATGCSRNAKNCSAYDGVDFSQGTVAVQAAHQSQN